MKYLILAAILLSGCNENLSGVPKPTIFKGKVVQKIYQPETTKRQLVPSFGRMRFGKLTFGKHFHFDNVTIPAKYILLVKASEPNKRGAVVIKQFNVTADLYKKTKLEQFISLEN